ncbi:HNH endonuclease signature motif containing protein [Anaerolineales bacterium HSG6]|nr:HNH endonuclease signature motif containing protein [Anaerolineales bacterium HSG6]
MAKRACYCCEYCHSQVDFATQSFSVEHIIPRSQGGKTELNNLAFACPGCNGHKYTKTKGYDPVSGEFVPLYHPRLQKWSDHFCWNDSFTLMLGITPAGRATVETLQLNREGVQNLRYVLREMGKHPPILAD